MHVPFQAPGGLPLRVARILGWPLGVVLSLAGFSRFFSKAGFEMSHAVVLLAAGALVFFGLALDGLRTPMDPQTAPEKVLPKRSLED